MADKKNRAERMLRVQAAKICNAFKMEAEEVLEDTESVVKDCFPSKSLKNTLDCITDKLEDEGIEATFDYKISREALRKTAGIEATDEEVAEARDAIIDAVVAEFEELLGDVDEVADETVESIVKAAEEDDIEVDAEDIEDALKCNIESKLGKMGVKCRLARTQKAKRIAKMKERREKLAKIRAKRAAKTTSKATKPATRTATSRAIKPSVRTSAKVSKPVSRMGKAKTVKASATKRATKKSAITSNPILAKITE